MTKYHATHQFLTGYDRIKTNKRTNKDRRFSSFFDRKAVAAFLQNRLRISHRDRGVLEAVELFAGADRAQDFGCRIGFELRLSRGVNSDWRTTQITRSGTVLLGMHPVHVREAHDN
jgi:hypothetical protein